MSLFKFGLIGKTPPGKLRDIFKHLTREKIKKPTLPDVFPASEAQIPEKTLTRDMFKEAQERFKNAKAGGGMLVQPGFGGTRQAYGAAKGSGIKLSAAQIKKLKENLSAEDFNKLDFDRTGLQSGQVNYGVGQRDNKSLFRKVVNILEPGKTTSAVKIINNEKLSNALIKSANAGDDIQTIIKKMNKLDKSLSRNQISSAINALVKRGQISEEFGRVRGKDLTIGEQQAYNKIIEKEVNAGKLNRAQIARKADVADSVVEDWIIANKGQKFYDENYTYEKGRLKTGTLQKQKDLFNYIETVDNISAKEVKKIFKMGSGKETQQLMSDLISVIYRMRGNTKSGSLIVPYKDEGRMRDVLRKIRNAPDFEDIYQRRIGDLVRDAYPKGPKRKQALKSLGEYWNFSRALRETAPELALNLDHVVPFGFLEEVKQGQNPINLIKVKPIPGAVNRFKANFDSARVNLNRQLKINPTDKNLLKKFNTLKELEKITPIEFGGISSKGNVYDFKAKPIGQSDLIKDAVEGLRTYDRVGKFSKKVLADKTLQKKFIEAGVDVGKEFSAFRRIQPIPEKTKVKVRNLVATLGGGRCNTRGILNQGGRVGLQDGTPSVVDCYNRALKRIQKGGVDFTRAETMNFNKLTKGLKAVGANDIVRFGLLPDALLEGALAVDRMVSEGDTGMQSLRKSFFAIPFQQMGVAKTYDEGQREEILNPQLLNKNAAPLGEEQKKRVQDVFNAQDRLNKKFNLIEASEGFKKQIAATDAVGDGPFGYVGDTQDLQKRLSDARENLQDMYRLDPRTIDPKQDIRRAERLLTTKPMDLNINDQLIMDAYKSAVEKADALRAGRIKVKPGTGFGVDAQIRRRMKDIPINIDTAKEDLEETGKMFGIGYTPLGLNQLFPALGLQSREFGVDPVTGKYDQDRGLQDYTNYLRTLQFADTFRDEKAGGGIAKLAGVDSGPPPASGPNSQGLQGLMKRVKRM